MPFNGYFDKLRNLAPEGSWVFLGQAGTALAGLAGMKLITHFLDPSEFGKLALVNTIAGYIAVNSFGPLASGMVRFWHISKERGQLKDLCLFLNRLSDKITLFFLGLAVFLGLILLSAKRQEWAIFLVFAVSLGIVNGRLGLRMSVFIACRKRKLQAIIDISNAIFCPLIAALLLNYIRNTAYIVLCAYILVFLNIFWIAGYFYPVEIRDLKGKGNLSNTGLNKEVFAFMLPFFAWGFFGWAHTSCDRWVLQHFYWTGIVGNFAVVSQLAFYSLGLGSGFLTSLFSPVAYQKSGDSAMDYKSKAAAVKIFLAMTLIYILAASVLILVFWLFHHQLLLLVSNKRFTRFSSLLPGLTFAWGLFFLGQIFTQFGILLNKPRLYLFPKIFSALLAAGAVFFLCKRLGPPGIVWGLVLANATYCWFCYRATFSKVSIFELTRGILIE